MLRTHNIVMHHKVDGKSVKKSHKAPKKRKKTQSSIAQRSLSTATTPDLFPSDDFTFHTPTRVPIPTDAPYSTDFLRESYINYFKSQGHEHLPSAPVVPHHDPSLLFTAAGMVPFKNVFLGIEQPPNGKTRVTTAQRCVRAGGKHNDLDNVGYTSRHHTFFEMLGNFSFGDYFKEEAIYFAWDYLTNVLKLPKDRLMVSVFDNDDEAAALWAKISGFKESNGTIRRMGVEDNFWQMGDVGPCGPCSEIYFDQQKEVDGEQFLEIWNLVFMQYNRQENGDMLSLEKPCVDTGMGLERLAAVIQGVHNNFDNDVFLSMINKIGKTALISNNLHDLSRKSLHSAHEKPIFDSAIPQTAEEAKKLHDQRVTATRVITDHLRAIISMLYDGVQPSSQSRGYVLRRILRRACRYGLQLGYTAPFMYLHVEDMVKLMEKSIPGIAQHAKQLRADIFREEKLFSTSMNKGMKIIGDYISKTDKDAMAEFVALQGSGEIISSIHTKHKQFPVDLAFQLYDAHGFPIDLTELCVKDLGYSLDTAAVEALLTQRKLKSREAWAAGGTAKNDGALTQHLIDATFDLWRGDGHTSMFVGYEKTFVENTCILGIVPVGDVDEKNNKQTVMLMLEECPFYPTGGGQVSDTGVITIRIPKHILSPPNINDPLAAKTQKDENGNKVYFDSVSLHVTNAIKHHSGEMIGLVAEMDLTSSHNQILSPEQILSILQNLSDFENDIINPKIAKNKAKGKQWLNKVYVSASVDANIRDQTSIHHTTTHLLQAALQRVLHSTINEIGDDHHHMHDNDSQSTVPAVKQAGSHVHHSSLRFDFGFSRPLTKEEINAVEDQVNAIALRHIPVNITQMGIDEARAMGAMALFGEKYGSEVRVVSIGESIQRHNDAMTRHDHHDHVDHDDNHSSDDEGHSNDDTFDKFSQPFSIELCGGTHVKNTVECYPFVILSENGVSSGTRRIEAISGVEASKYLTEQHRTLKVLKQDSLLKIHHLAEPAEMVTAVAKLKQKHDQLQTKNKDLEKKQLEMIMSGGQALSVIENLQNTNPYLSSFWSTPNGWTSSTITPTAVHSNDAQNNRKPVIVLYNVPAAASEDYGLYRKFTEDVFTKQIAKYNEFMKMNEQSHIQSITHAFIGETNGKGLIYSNISAPNKKDKHQVAAMSMTDVKPFDANDLWKSISTILPKSKGGGKPELSQGTFDLTEIIVPGVDIAQLQTSEKIAILTASLQLNIDAQYDKF